eukprot:scaffold2191_cov254-Pinguiococcus_pyrenoidosus.AAC.35
MSSNNNKREDGVWKTESERKTYDKHSISHTLTRMSQVKTHLLCQRRVWHRFSDPQPTHVSRQLRVLDESRRHWALLRESSAVVGFHAKQLSRKTQTATLKLASCHVVMASRVPQKQEHQNQRQHPGHRAKRMKEWPRKHAMRSHSKKMAGIPRRTETVTERLFNSKSKSANSYERGKIGRAERTRKSSERRRVVQLPS